MEVTVVIVGRVNAGKSTLFNALLGTNRALAHKTSGVTRDVNECNTVILGKTLTLVDTPGLMGKKGLQGKMLEHTEKVVLSSTLILYTVDGSKEAGEEDFFWIDKIRRLSLPVLLVINKSDKKAFQCHSFEYMGMMGKGSVSVSAAHRDGIENLKEEIVKTLPADGNSPIQVEKRRVRFVIVGRPNVGKSTLFNALLKEEVVLVDDEPGITRDVIKKDFEYGGIAYSLMDTPGLRRKSRIDTDLERYIADQMHQLTRHGVHIAIFVLDAAEGVTRQDALLVHKYLEEGFGVVAAANKWDVVDAVSFQRSFDLNLLVGGRLPLVKISALKGTNLKSLMESVKKLDKIMRRELKTGEVNRWLGKAIRKVRPPYTGRGRQLKLKYMTQVRSYPPRFLIFGNGNPPDNYRRYLSNELRDHFGIVGCDVRISYRHSKSPWERLDK